MALRNADQWTEVELAPLNTDDTARLAAQAAGQELDPITLAQIFRETEGNPLFVVETVRARVEQQGFIIGDQAVRDNHSPLATCHSGPVPPKVQAVIQSRLAQLSPQARELVALAATIGRSFTFAILLQASAAHEDVVVRGLDELWQRRIVREQGADTYDFSHDRIREAAYAQVSSVRRRVMHRRVAEALEIAHASALDSVSSQIADHFVQAGLPAQAILYYQRAGATAQRLYANHEACLLLRKGLALLATVAEGNERSARELALQSTLGVSLMAVKGHANEEVKEVYLRAQLLCRQLGQSPDIPILRGLASVFTVRGELYQAYALSVELLELAQATRTPEHLVEAHYGLGVNYVWMGNFMSARHHLTQVIAHYDPRQQQVYIARYGQDPSVTGHIWLALALWFLGYPDQALHYGEAALALARELAHPMSHAYALMWYGMLHEYLRNPVTTLTYAEKTIALSTEHGFPLWASQGITHRGWALSELGQPEEGLVQIRMGMAAHEQTGARAPRPWHLTLLAATYGKLSRFKEALATLDEALALAEKNGILDCQAERWRLKGELMLQSEVASPGSAPEQEAEQCFLKAIEVAQSQQAKSLELRATLSLSRLWQRQGKPTAAGQILTEIYDWFTEGFATPDLQAAKALLDELS